jgi:multidrug efflux pump subunit AcrA (membrane-fusion protein)
VDIGDSYTILKAGESGVITARFAETGQVVEQARAVFTLAKDGPRDAVFDVYEAIFRPGPRRCQSGDFARLKSEGHGGRHRARGSPAVDTNTGTVRVKVGIPQTPPAMTLGAVVTGSGNLKSSKP